MPAICAQPPRHRFAPSGRHCGGHAAQGAGCLRPPRHGQFRRPGGASGQGSRCRIQGIDAPADHLHDGRSAHHLRSLDLLFVAKSIERIGDHAKNISEYVVYMVKGRDVRHIGLEAMEKEVAGR
jgi:hypothetical protein